MICISTARVGLSKRRLGGFVTLVAAAAAWAPSARADEPSSRAGVTAYGWVLPTFAAASGPVSSFGIANQQAATGAYPTSFANGEALFRTRFAVSQSRLGVAYSPVPALRLVGEADLVDLALSAPVLTMRPRLRQAFIAWEVGANTELLAGQAWDLLNPGLPFTYNVVGLFYTAGNVGFMRQQLRLTYRTAPWELAAAVAGSGIDTNASDGAVGLNKVPLLQLRATYRTAAGAQLGAAAVAGTVAYSRGGDVLRRPLWGIDAFATASVGRLESIGLVYAGQNLADSGSLTIANGGPRRDGREVGAYVSGRLALDGPWRLHGGLGAAFSATASRRVTNFDPVAAANGTTSILHNIAVKLGGSRRLLEHLDAFAEYSLFATRYQLTPKARYFIAHGLEVGLVCPFGGPGYRASAPATSHRGLTS